MKIADLDNETRAVLAVAHIVHRFPTADNLNRLGDALKAYDKEHEAERSSNLLHAVERLGMIVPSGWIFNEDLEAYEYLPERLQVVKRSPGKWRLFHNQRDTGHEFDTAYDAMEHANDARIHGH